MNRVHLAAATAFVTAVSLTPGVTAAASAPSAGRTMLVDSGVIGGASGARVHYGSPAPDATPMSLTLQLPLRNQALADRLIARGTVLSQARYAALVAPSAASIARVRSWATGRGFTVTSVSRNSGQVSVEASVGRIDSAFGVRVHSASLGTRRGLAVTSNPTVPNSLGLSGIAGLNALSRAHTTHIKLPTHARSAASTSGRVAPKAVSDGSKACATYWGSHLYPSASGQKFALESNYLCGYLPADLSTMYGVQAAQSKAPAIGLLLWGNEPAMLAQTNRYMSAYGYPQLKTYVTNVAASNAQVQARHADCDPYNAGGETALDVQSSHAISPNSPIYYYGAKSCYDNDLSTELQLMVDQHKVSTISMSFGGYQDDAGSLMPADRAAYDRALQQASLTGISTFAASGDDGDNSTQTTDAAPHVGYPASSAYVTAVGGTSIGYYQNGTRAVTAGWEDQFLAQPSPTAVPTSVVPNHEIYGAGGGVSSVSTIPTWQKGVVSGSTTHRVVPDVAALADPYTGYQIRDTYYTENANGVPTGAGVEEYDTYGGTSLATPIVAAIVALAKAYNNVAVGLATPRLYAMLGTSALLDVNAPSSAGVYYESPSYGKELVVLDGKPQNLVTKAGWDPVTGVGEPNGMSFIAAFR
ncbi:S53 family peptidase [Allobranchiibius sp. GilTou38]|uniref:S8 family serine peptidase n=1 Tax=Allobranchiibius sp. GilTou38 TaxID=2815210 RepID=UPI001AA14FE1|nr:S8/S53 family peptidase [Allobranchiibius sp. GilTou38]